MANRISLGAVGILFKIRIRDDEDNSLVSLVSATTKDIHFISPRGVSKIRAASLMTDGSDGRIKYTSVAGDLDEAGDWTIYTHIVTPSLDVYSTERTFTVYSRR